VPEHADPHPHEPVDPDLRWPPGSPEYLAATIAVVSAGGVVGALARYGAWLSWPTAPGSFPWTTLLINVVGCLLIGVLVVLTSEVFTAHPLVRPALATGVLGGFTTFSTFAVDTQDLLAGGNVVPGIAYVVLTPVLALVAVTVAASVTRLLARQVVGAAA
jgi:CrcB protein